MVIVSIANNETFDLAPLTGRLATLQAIRRSLRRSRRLSSLASASSQVPVLSDEAR